MEAQQESEQLSVVDYTEKSFVVCGELTRTYKDDLKNLGGRFNKNLKYEGNPLVGWVFPMKNKEKVMEFVLSVNSGEAPAKSTEIPSMNDMGIPRVPVPSVNTSRYQFVKFKVFRPSVGMKVRLVGGGKTVHGQVVQTESSNQDILDTVYIDFDGQTSMGAICRGKWQIFGYFEDHTLYFS